MNARRFARYFVRGCLVLVPLAMTLYIIWFTLSTIDRLLPIGIPGVGLILTVALITAVGFLTSNVIGRSVFDLTDGILARLPLVKLIYTSLKDLVRAFVGDQKSFNRPAAVSLTPGGEARLLGFVTRDGLAPLGYPTHVAVYFPQSYNFAGNLMIVPREQVELLDVSSAELMTFVVSGGISASASANPSCHPRASSAVQTTSGATAAAPSLPERPVEPPRRQERQVRHQIFWGSRFAFLHDWCTVRSRNVRSGRSTPLALLRRTSTDRPRRDGRTDQRSNQKRSRPVNRREVG